MFNTKVHKRKEFKTFAKAKQYRMNILKDWFQVVILPRMRYGKQTYTVSCNFKRVK